MSKKKKHPYLVTPGFNPNRHKEKGLPPKLISAFKEIVDYLSNDPLMSEEEKENYHNSHIRATKAFLELHRPLSEIHGVVRDDLSTGFPM